MSDRIGRLLIVDDDAGIREVLEEILSSVALQIVLAENGNVALQKILGEKFDCVVSDINMPMMTGLELLKEVRRQSVAIPFIMVSGYGDQENLREVLKLGAMDFIDKPFDSKQMRTVTRQALEYGNLLHQIDSKIEEAFKDSKLPPAKIAQLKEMQRQLMKMKAVSSVYLKVG